MAVPLKKLEDQLNCPICMDTYTNPKQLQCNHVYCQQCLVKLVFRDRQEQLTLTCPNCRQVTPIPASGVAGLQPAFRVNQLLDIVEEHKKLAVTTEKVESASAGPTPDSKLTVVCPEHGGKEVDLYCETCGETICWECIMKGSKHHSHDYQKLNEAFEIYKEEMFTSLEPLENQLTAIERALQVFDARHDEISHQREIIENDILETITQMQKKLYDALEVRKTELINQLDQLTQVKLKSLAVQRDQIETTQAQLSSCLSFMRENLKTGNQREALMMKCATVRQVKELTTTFQPDMLEPNTEANMMFTALADLSTTCRNYGTLSVSGPPDPSKCIVTGKGLDTAELGETSTALLQMLDCDSWPCKTLATSISCELLSEIAGTKKKGFLNQRGQSQYEISYQPTIKGLHQLHIKVDGKHIQKSPFFVCVRSPAEKLGTPILTIDGLKGPTGVALYNTGKVVVVECHGHNISVFSPSGKKIRSFGTHGSGCGQFKFPASVAVDNKKNILVADSNNHRIQKFSAQGNFLIVVGTEGSGPLQFKHPCGVAVSPSSGLVYVVDSENNRIQILNPDFSYSSTFGKKGSGKGQFKNPRHAAVDSIGNVYVADSGNHRIQVFTAEGEFLRMFGRLGAGRGDLNEPYSVAVDFSGRVYVSECINRRISVFTSDNQFVTSFGNKDMDPRRLAVDSSGVVYVCEETHNCVKLF